MSGVNGQLSIIRGDSLVKPGGLQRIAGWLAVTMLLSHLLAVGGLLSSHFVTGLAWFALIAMWPALKASARRQSSLLFILGLGGLLVSRFSGMPVDWVAVFAKNVPLLSMFVAISFLALTNTAENDEKLPRGSRAAVTTAVGTNILGSVINLSVIFMFGDRLKRNGVLTDAQQIVLARCFSAAAWWSPFFIATGVALMYAPGMEWKLTVVPGVMMATMGVVYTVVNANKLSGEAFQGYPIHRESLVVPMLLATSVLVLHHYFPDASIVFLISTLSLFGSIVLMKGRPRRATLLQFVDHQLLSAGSQFALFLAAGVFSAGITALLMINPGVINLSSVSFDTGLFALCSGGMIVVGLIGVHPVVSIAVVSPLLLPLNPDMTSLGFMFLSTWAISTAAGPLSGIGLVMTGRFGAGSRQILRNNWHYALTMWVLACGLNQWMFH